MRVQNIKSDTKDVHVLGMIWANLTREYPSTIGFQPGTTVAGILLHSCRIGFVFADAA